MNNWIEISEENLLHNYAVLQAAAGPATEVLAVVKANAYGHGAEHCSRVLAAGGTRWLGVTCAAEGARVRQVAPEARILIMSGFLPEDVPLIREHDLTPVIWTDEHLRWLAAESGLRVHLEIDTGMGRQGCSPGEELDRFLSSFSTTQLILDGVFTHFCSSEVAGSSLTRRQQGLFVDAIAQVKNKQLQPEWIHAGNSSAIDNPPLPTTWLTQLAERIGARAIVRSGLALYGLCLPIEGEALAHVRPDLRPVLTWKARILSVRDLNPGDTVGYNATFTAPHPMRVALIPAGYADGLRRELSGPQGWVVISGHRAPILGRISMNLTVVDITGLSQVRAADEAILLGPGITTEDHARLARTIPYEILCGIHPCG